MRGEKLGIFLQQNFNFLCAQWPQSRALNGRFASLVSIYSSHRYFHSSECCRYAFRVQIIFRLMSSFVRPRVVRTSTTTKMLFHFSYFDFDWMRFSLWILNGREQFQCEIKKQIYILFLLKCYLRWSTKCDLFMNSIEIDELQVLQSAKHKLRIILWAEKCRQKY